MCLSALGLKKAKFHASFAVAHSFSMGHFVLNDGVKALKYKIEHKRRAGVGRSI
jgi:hypothetical protein